MSKAESVGGSFLAFVLGPIWLLVIVAVRGGVNLGNEIILVAIVVYASLFLFGLPVFLILWKLKRMTPAGAVLIGAVAGPLPPIIYLMWASASMRGTGLNF